MKISDKSTVPVGPPVRPERASESAAPPSSTVDRVTATEAADIRKAVAVVRDLIGSARSAKLVQLEAAVRSGSYPPNPGKIAAQILDEAVLSAQIEAQLKR